MFASASIPFPEVYRIHRLLSVQFNSEVSLRPVKTGRWTKVQNNCDSLTAWAVGVCASLGSPGRREASQNAPPSPLAKALVRTCTKDSKQETEINRKAGFISTPAPTPVCFSFTCCTNTDLHCCFLASLHFSLTSFCHLFLYIL